MNERDFCYWLQGCLELSGSKALDENQVKIIKEHLALVFTKVTSLPAAQHGHGGSMFLGLGDGHTVLC